VNRTIRFHLESVAALPPSIAARRLLQSVSMRQWNPFGACVGIGFALRFPLLDATPNKRLGQDCQKRFSSILQMFVLRPSILRRIFRGCRGCCAHL
jgi:hypothetical protein